MLIFEYKQTLLKKCVVVLRYGISMGKHQKNRFYMTKSQESYNKSVFLQIRINCRCEPINILRVFSMENASHCIVHKFDNLMG